ncbi:MULTISPECIES: hypothetical protein [Bacillus]|uniref:Uncharacterized protein n=2 Tax=Bacillus thuringiensis TaxID=1428 RepID=A0AAP4Q711_BACTU|nr:MULTISPECIES: hypothetical protein [Bacillus]MEC0046263.1 hypothetical protein [Bacillus cereus]AFV21626.1 hypothetical protein BTB_502p03210 [Bacillus thuringiensis Bt407]EEM25345.1 hypothetical protein bthur0002_59870 [Bacillus thuringiensis Bt407]ERI01198.1 hypothetical protein BTCBT_002753 [Bacillus thuringiensis T01-328]MBN6707950.1 hypothetical protein [Bacillus thuringiensis]
MTQENNEFIEQANEILSPFEEEIRTTILMSSLMAVSARDGIKNIEQARVSIIQDIINRLDSLNYTNLVTLHILSYQFKNNDDSVKKQRFVKNEEKTFYTKEDVQRVAKENYNKGVIEGEKSLLNEIKNENYPELVQNLFMKKVEEGYKKANEEHRTIGFQTAYQRGFKEGLEKGKELRIKELRKMREWE